MYKDKTVCVVVPAYNEELTIGKVIDDFRRELPQSDIYVFNNCSTDATVKIALSKGAKVINESRKGKGFVVESIFNHIDADIYVMVDGDDTYPASRVNELIQPIQQNTADCVVGARLANFSKASFRPLHLFGNNLVRLLVNWIGKADLTDIMSGYRSFSRRVVRTIPIVSSGFEVETEMTIQMLQHRIKVLEVQIPYKERPAGSKSKLNTFKDGVRVLWKIFRLFREFKPLTFFGSAGIIFFILAIAAGLPSIFDYIQEPDHYVRHIPSAILATGLMLLSAGNIFLGILLHSLNWKFRELHNVLTRSRVSGD